MIQLTDKVYSVQVPQDKTCKPEDMTFANFYPHASKEVDEIIWIKCNGNSFTQKIPPGSWRFLFTTKTATEEQARKVVRELPVGARYENYNSDYPVWYHTCKESLSSLLRSKKLDPKNNYALIEKLK